MTAADSPKDKSWWVRRLKEQEAITDTWVARAKASEDALAALAAQQQAEREASETWRMAAVEERERAEAAERKLAEAEALMLGVSESLCELEVQARNASRAPTLGGVDKESVQSMLGRLASSLEVQQNAIGEFMGEAHGQ